MTILAPSSASGGPFPRSEKLPCWSAPPPLATLDIPTGQLAYLFSQHETGEAYNSTKKRSYGTWKPGQSGARICLARGPCSPMRAIAWCLSKATSCQKGEEKCWLLQPRNWNLIFSEENLETLKVRIFFEGTSLRAKSSMMSARGNCRGWLSSCRLVGLGLDLYVGPSQGGGGVGWGGDIPSAIFLPPRKFEDCHWLYTFVHISPPLKIFRPPGKVLAPPFISLPCLAMGLSSCDYIDEHSNKCEFSRRGVGAGVVGVQPPKLSLGPLPLARHNPSSRLCGQLYKISQKSAWTI